MNITLVTGLWNIKREELSDGWSRSYQHYLNKFEQLLTIDCNLIIFGDEELKKFVFERRKEENTQFIIRDTNWFKNEFYDKIQKIRTNPSWYNQVGWLKDSTQAKLEMYNPLVVSKMFLLNDARILDRFNSNKMFWIDGGITNTVDVGYFNSDKILDKLKKITNKFLFIKFPYETGPEIHGFDRKEMNRLAGVENIEYVCRGGFFGGNKDSIGEINSIYYALLNDTLNRGLMGTEESIFTLMSYQYPELFDLFSIKEDGLIYNFFEYLKYTEIKKSEGVNLYVLGFNSPKQFEKLCESYTKNNSGFIIKTKNFLINNSTDLSTTDEYLKICKEYNFEHIKKDNIGICGGRQFIAEHFDSSDSKYCVFLEDDMNLCGKDEKICKNGFNRYIPSLLEKVVKIMDKENYDFLKFSYTEFFGDNGTQWSWYNVPQIIREKYWPEKTTLPKVGIDSNAPKTKFNNIKSIDGLSYIDGEIYYCNWPQIVSKEGNRKMFLETKWGHPFEQTWMSHFFQLTKENKLNGSVLLLSPINHNRFQHYDGKIRREN